MTLREIALMASALTFAALIGAAIGWVEHLAAAGQESLL